MHRGVFASVWIVALGVGSRAVDQPTLRPTPRGAAVAGEGRRAHREESRAGAEVAELIDPPFAPGHHSREHFIDACHAISIDKITT